MTTYICTCNNTTKKSITKKTFDNVVITCNNCNKYLWDDSPNNLRAELDFYLLKLGTNKVYMEAGSNDGISQSNTYHLEQQRGWRGILVEPCTEIYNICKKNRSENNIFYNNFLTNDLTKNISYLDTGTQCPLMYSFSKEKTEHPVINITINKILENFGDNIDFLSLDIEGWEMNALKGMDLNKYRPQLICIEISRDVKFILEMFKKFNFTLLKKVGHDYIFSSNESIKKFI